MVTVGYADESVRGRYHLMALAVVPPHLAAEVDRHMRAMRLPGQRRIHMVDERDSRRRQLIGSVVDLGAVRGAIYLAPRPVLSARPVCLSALAADAVDLRVDRLILDRGEEHQNRRDRATLRYVLGKSSVTYSHAPSWEYSGLQIADLLAWAYGAGGDWRRRVRPMLDRVRRLDP